MRRKDRERDEAWALSVMHRAPYITVSMTQKDGTAYAVPLSLAELGGNWYFHCASVGRKLDTIKENSQVCLTAVAHHEPFFEEKKDNFTTRYQSTIAFGVAEVVTDETEKCEALRAICKRFLPERMEFFEAAIERSLKITTVVRIRLTIPPTGKERT